MHLEVQPLRRWLNQSLGLLQGMGRERGRNPHVKKTLLFPIQAIGRITSNGPVPDFVCRQGHSEAGLDSNHNKAKTVLVAVNGAAKTPAARVINPFAANAV